MLESRRKDAAYGDQARDDDAEFTARTQERAGPDREMVPPSTVAAANQPVTNLVPIVSRASPAAGSSTAGRLLMSVDKPK